MISKIKKPVSILLSLIMVFSVFAIVPLSASAAVGDVLSEDDYLTFTAEEDGSTVTLKVAAGSNFQYDLNGTGLTGYTAGTPITLEDKGDYVRFCGTGTKFNSSNHVSLTGKVACSGNVMSLRLNGGKVQGLENLCFRYMFYNCTGLTTAPDLLETDLKAGCYSYMFNGCTSLTTAPDLPATTLAESCYSYMFYGCTSLTTAPELPATTLAESCYSYMFNGCTSLTTAPDLPATVLAINCYLSMFNGCTSLTEAPELPATMLANYCYQNMFRGCTKLTEAPELTATTLASYCYSNMFRDCKSLTEAPELPATNLAQYCYASMFYGCTSLTKAPELPATNLAVSCYNYMFYGCTSLTELPALPATTLQSSCYYGMFSGCSKICISDEAVTLNGITYSAAYRIPTTGEGTSATNALTSMFTSTGGKFKGTPNINTTYYVPAPTYTVTWKNWDGSKLEKDENVAAGSTPSYGGATPTKTSDKYYDYTFSGWSDSSNTYAADALPAVSGDVTYTAQYTATAKTFKAYAKKLSGETYTIENLTGETTVAQLKEIIADQTDIPATAQRLIFAGKQLEDAKTLAEYNIEKESTFHLLMRGYTVTWLNYDNSELGTTTVQYGATPSYDGETPTKEEDADNTYTFSGWTDGSNTYAADALPAVSGDVTYTAVYTAEPKIPAPQLPDVIKDCTYYDSYCGFYANVPFAERFSDIKNGAIICDSYSETEKSIMDTKDYSYKFYDQAGTELQAENVYHDDSADGYGFRVIMNVFEFSNPISGPLYIVVTAPAPAHTHTDANGDTITFEPWESTNSLPASGNYYLTDNVTVSVTTQTTDTLNLCLNGKTVTQTARTGSIYRVDPGTVLNLYDEQGDSGKLTDGKGSLNNHSGGNVWVYGGTFNMYGGTISSGSTSDDEISSCGGGVFVSKNNGTAGTFNMYGGVITGNTSANGGGVNVYNGSTVNIYGGTITGNTAYFGGGVIVCSSTLNLYGGTITGNSYDASLYPDPDVNQGLVAGGADLFSYGSSTVNLYGEATVGKTTTTHPITIKDSLGSKVYEVALVDSSDSYNFKNGVITSGLSGKGDASNFTNGNGEGYSLTLNASGEAQLLRMYTVTWKMDNGTTIDTTSAAQGTAPTHADPTKPDDAQYTYTFAGWQNGTTTYAPDTALPPVTGDTTYTATFTQTKKKLFAKHSIALNGNIGVNFFINSAYADFDGAQTATVVFTWDDGNYTKVVNLKELTKDSDGLYKATCDVVAAHMAHKIHAEVFIDGVLQEETDDFSVQDHAEAILADPAKYDKRNNPEALVALVKEMLNYGAMAQIAFESNLNEKPAPANTKAISDYDYVMADVTADDVLNAIKESNNGKSGADMTAVAASLGANWYTTTMIYMSQNTVKHYFTKATDDFVPTDYQGNQNNYYYYVQKQDIAAAELDGLQTFTVGDVTFQYSALDYVKTVIESNKMEDYAKNIAKALFLYNQAANAYFDTPVIITT